MRLRRVEAARFGRLVEASLGPLGDGLTVVLGPNEAGKSTFTALVRYILYGFPSKGSTSSRPYLSEAGRREGRLVFDSADGEWVVERVEGPHGGASTVRTLRGPDRPGLVEELTAGVSAEAYRVVFGFGLAEMAEIERAGGPDDDIISRLYAAGAGLRVSPREVRAAIEAEADALYRPRGSTRVINKLGVAARDLRSRLAELEREGETLATERARLAELEAALEDARRDRDAAALRSRTLAEERRVLFDLEASIRQAEGELVALRRAAREASAAAEAIPVDDTVSGLATDIAWLAGELSGFRGRLDTIRKLESESEARARECEARLAQAGLAAEAAAALDLSAETRSAADAWRDRLLSTAQRARDAARERDEAADEWRAASGADVPSRAAPRLVPREQRVLAWTAIAVGALIAGHGVLTGQWLQAVAGGITLAYGLLMVALHAAFGRGAAPGQGAERVSALGERAERLRLAAERAEQEAAETRAEWLAWLEARGLAGPAEPADVVRVLDFVAEARGIEAARLDAEVRRDAERAEAADFTARVVEAARAAGTAAPDAPSEAVATVVRLTERLAEATAAREARAAAEREARAAAAAVADAEERQALAIGRAQEIIARLGMSGGLAELAATAEQAEREAAAAQERWGTLTSERAALATRVGEKEREDTMGALRLELSSVNERITAHAERFAELSVAAKLLQRAQERYERERQPDVVREAQRAFATMTGGRYQRVTVPLGSAAIEVFEDSARARHTGLLSTGTAEQLYLSLRLALIGQLEDTGASLPILMDDVFANFDPERKAGAATAVAELARTRQVVVFTCHPQTVEVFERAAPGLASLTLDRC